MEETNKSLTIKDLLIRLILIVIFIFLLIWLFPMPDLKPLNNQIFADNIDRMRNVAKSYYTVERLPKNINDFRKMTLKEMIDSKMILPLIDSNNKTCSGKDSYVKVTKHENEYIIKIFLSCSDKQDYVIEHFGCYDICSDKCIVSPTTYGSSSNSKKPVITTGKNNGKLYEYQYSKNVCKDHFDKYVCPTGYNLVGNKCMKKGSHLITEAADKKVVTISSLDVKDAKKDIKVTENKFAANEETKYSYSTINANKNNKYYNKVVTKRQKITATKSVHTSYKNATKTTRRSHTGYKQLQHYSVITAQKVATAYKWSYVSTLTSNKSNLAFTNDNEKLVLVDWWEEPACDTCFTTVKVYKYYRYKKEYTNFKYSCSNFDGYELYNGNKCRKKTYVSKSCPSGYTDSGKDCIKDTVTYSCSKHGSDYKFDSKNTVCYKQTYSYSCPSGTRKDSDERYCIRDVYGCPKGTTENGGKCVKTSYSCPSNTSDKTYTLSGSTCNVKTKYKTYTCPSGTTQTSDKKQCIRRTYDTVYSCSNNPGYKLVGNKCTKTITSNKDFYSCKDGFTLSGKTCYKTVSKNDTKNAEAKYKTICNIEYKWSTKKHIDGWKYTGKKREVR